MKQICAKIYYEISTGEVLTITSECQGNVEETTKEQDIKIHEQLKIRNIDEIDYIELPYGTLEITFTNAKSYSVNLETKALDCVYYTQVDLDAQTLEVETKQVLANRVAAIHEYVQAQDETSLSTIEDSILQIEIDKTLNGGM